jgi:hypothetical protein
MSATTPCDVPGDAGWNGFPARPAPIGADTSTARHQSERVEHDVALAITGEKALRNRPIRMSQPGLRLAGAAHQGVETPIGVGRRVNHGEGSTRELAGLHQGPAPDPLDPIVDVGTRQQIGHGVGVVRGSLAEEGLEEPDLVVPQHAASPTSLHQGPNGPEDLKARRTTVDQIPDQPELEFLAVNGSDPLEELRKLIAATLDISDEDRLHDREL